MGSIPVDIASGTVILRAHNNNDAFVSLALETPWISTVSIPFVHERVPLPDLRRHFSPDSGRHGFYWSGFFFFRSLYRKIPLHRIIGEQQAVVATTRAISFHLSPRGQVCVTIKPYTVTVSRRWDGREQNGFWRRPGNLTEAAKRLLRNDHFGTMCIIIGFFLLLYESVNSQNNQKKINNVYPAHPLAERTGRKKANGRVISNHAEILLQKKKTNENLRKCR